MQEHKTKLITNYSEKNIDGIIEVLLSLRVNALQIAPELRKNLVYELIRNDIFQIEENDSFDFLLSILDIPNNSLKHAITSLISVISSTLRGVEYLICKNKMVVIDRVIKVLASLTKPSECYNITTFIDLKGARERKRNPKILHRNPSKVQYQRYYYPLPSRA